MTAIHRDTDPDNGSDLTPTGFEEYEQLVAQLSSCSEEAFFAALAGEVPRLVITPAAPDARTGRKLEG